MSKNDKKTANKSANNAAEEPSKKIADQVIQLNENGARQAILEDLFYDFHKSRKQVFLMNFLRGIFFGLGSALGATLLVAVLIWVLGQFGNVFPPIADFVNGIIDAMNRPR